MNNMIHFAQHELVGHKRQHIIGAGAGYKPYQSEQSIDQTEYDAEGAGSLVCPLRAEIQREGAGHQMHNVMCGAQMHPHQARGRSFRVVFVPGLAERVEVRLGPALDTLQRLGAENAGPFDLIFIDADKPTLPEYFRWALRLSRPGTLIAIDNVVRDGAVIDSGSLDASVQGVRRLNELMASEPRVSATAIQTVGAKGYDGFALALVTGP